MIINLDELNTKDYIDINYKVEKDEYIDKRIYDLKDGLVKGKVYQNSNSDIILDCIFTGSMIIEDSITLDLVPYHFQINIEENLDNLVENYEDCYENAQNTLDLKTILWQNIVLEVPISYTLCKDANIKGNGWELKSETSEVQGTKQIDPRLKKLEDLLKGDD